MIPMHRMLAVVCVLLMVVAGTGLVGAAEITITMAARERVDFAELYAQLIEEFEASNPGIKVKWQGLVDLVGQLTTMMAAGVAPDVFEMWGDWATNWADKGQLLDLRPYVQRSMTAAEIRDFNPGDWEATFLRFGQRKGEQYGLPRYTNVGLTYYNVNRLEEAALADPYALSEQGRWTWEDLRDFARKLTYIDPGSSQRRYGADIILGGVGRVHGMLGPFGGRIISLDPLSYVMDQPEAIEGLEFHRRMMLDDQIISEGTNRSDWSNEKSSILLEASSSIGRYTEWVGGKFTWKLAPWPKGPAGRVSWAAGDKYGAYRYTKHPDATWKFLQYITSTRGTVVAAKRLGFAPPRRTAMVEYAKDYTRLNIQSQLVTGMEARVCETSQVPQGSKIATVVNEALNRIWKGGVAPKIAAMEIKAQVEALLHE